MEYAAINNMVIVLTDRSSVLQQYATMNSSRIKIDRMDQYSTGATRFSSVYKHLAGGKYKTWDLNGTSLYEMRCIQRWFILKDYMHRHSITKVNYLSFM